MNDNILFILIASSPFALYFIYKLCKNLIERQRWIKIKKETFPSQFNNFLMTSFHPYPYLSEEEKYRLQIKILYFLNYKNFWPIGELKITEEMKLIIAAQACLLIVNIDVEVYPSLKNIYLSAEPFIEKDNHIDEQTMLPAHSPRLGESWFKGPIVLSWSSIQEGVINWRDGKNVVLHEFTHQLDGDEGAMNGVPKLLTSPSHKDWKIFMSREFLKLRKKFMSHIHSDIDPYASTNPSEFFAVTVEEFFEKPFIFKNKHPELFKLYFDFFKIDPLKWS